ncbi:MAG: LysR family transcriptional regulator [Clostridiales bacterium]|nr:LysR family transcriptional regulator [Clostridiales bacterium]
METDYLKEFIVLSETGNYLQAAEELFIAQSSLSKHIKALEIELGVPLFNRTPRKVELTSYGKSFLKCAQQIVDIQYSFQRDLANQLDEKQQTLRIGSIPLMAPYRITDIIMKYQRENERCTINLLEEESFTLKEMLRKNKCDLAFIREEGDTDEEFAKFPYTSDHLVAILPSTHPLAKRSSLQLKELKDENFLLLQPDSLLYSISTTACQKAGFTPNIAYTGKRAENIMDLVEKGMGVSLLMEKPILSLATPKVSIVDVTPTVSTNIYIYYKKNIPLSAAAKKFLLAAL